MNMFLISINGKFNILVKIFNLQNFISYQKPVFMKFHGRYSKSFLVYEILPFLLFYKVMVVDNFDYALKVFSKKQSTFTCVDTRIFTVNHLTPYLLIFFDWYRVTPIIFMLAINCKKNKCSSFNNLRDTAHPKRKTFAKHLTIFTFL